MFSIFGRYLLRDTLVNWFGAISVLLLILMSSRFASFLGDAASGELPSSAVFTLLGLAMVKYLAVLIPVGLLFAIMLALGRLYRDSEMAAFMACGGGPGRLYRAYAWLTGALLVVLTVLAIYVSPWALRQSAVVRAQAEHEANYSLFEAGRFKSTKGGDQVLYTREVGKDGQLHDIFIHSYDEQGRKTVVRAALGRQTQSEITGKRMLVLKDGYRYSGAPGEAAYDIIAFAEHGISLESSEAKVYIDQYRFWPSEKLWQSEAPGAIAELQWRISTPIMLIVLTLIAVPLARTRPRQGRYGRLMAAILVYILYSNLLGLATVWIEKEYLPVVMGLWWVHLLFIGFALTLLAKQNGWFERLMKKVVRG